MVLYARQIAGIVAALAAMTLVAFGAVAQGPARPPAEKLNVVASFSILGDFVREVGGERIALTTLVGPGGDAHVYAPSPADGRRLAEAKIVFVNGLGYEGWMPRLVKASGARVRLVEASAGVEALAESEAGHRHGHRHAKGRDPHAWQSVANAKVYVVNIRDALAAADPEGRAVYEANAKAYLAKLDALEAEVRDAVAGIPPERRRIITSHDAFRYFAVAYGVDFVAPQGVSTESEASAADVARIIRQMRRDRIEAVFLETITDPRLAEQIAREAKGRVGGRLYSDALSPPDGPAGTYIEMMRHNIRALSAALSS